MTGISGAACRSHGGTPGSACMQASPVANISLRSGPPDQREYLNYGVQVNCSCVAGTSVGGHDMEGKCSRPLRFSNVWAMLPSLLMWTQKTVSISMRDELGK